METRVKRRENSFAHARGSAWQPGKRSATFVISSDNVADPHPRDATVTRQLASYKVAPTTDVLGRIEEVAATHRRPQPRPSKMP